jgi:regulator of sigma E protease
MALVLLQGARVPAFVDHPAVIGSVDKGGAAEAAGLQPGDRVVTVENQDIARWRDFELAVATRVNRPTRLGIDRNGTRIEREVVPKAIDRFETGSIGVLPVVHPQIAEIRKGEPGEEGGLRAGDVVVAAAGEKGPTRERLIELIQGHEGKPLTLDVLRGGSPATVTVVPRMFEGQVRIGATITAVELKTIDPGPVEAFKLSLEQNWEWTTLIFKTLGGLLTRDTSVKQLMGPVAIAGLSGDAARQETWIPLFTLMAMISLNLGLLNLMPIPVLDGGHIAILALEGVSRRDFSMKVKEKMLLAGFVLLLMLMATVIYNDLMRIQWIERLVPWR